MSIAFGYPGKMYANMQDFMCSLNQYLSDLDSDCLQDAVLTAGQDGTAQLIMAFYWCSIFNYAELSLAFVLSTAFFPPRDSLVQLLMMWLCEGS